MAFDGAKLALFLSDRLLVMRRDARMDITWPGTLDWPGGGREPGETPVDTVLRETEEEVGLKLAPADLTKRAETVRLGVHVITFVARLPAARVRQVQLGSEGQAWGLMTPSDFADHPDAVPSLVYFLRAHLDLGWPGHQAPLPGAPVPRWVAHLIRGWVREVLRRAAPTVLSQAELAQQIAPLLADGDRARIADLPAMIDTVLDDLVTRGEVARTASGLTTGPDFLTSVTGRVP